jgi:hypothetical protein
MESHFLEQTEELTRFGNRVFQPRLCLLAQLAFSGEGAFVALVCYISFILFLGGLNGY